MNDQPAPVSPAPRVLLLGLGQAGTSLLAATAAGGLDDCTLLAADTDALALSRQPLQPALALGPHALRGLSAGGEPARGRAAAEEAGSALREACAGRQLVVLLGGLGGGTATGALPVAARAAQEAGALTLAVVTLPFEFEGQRRQDQAAAGLEELRRAADAVMVLPNDKLAALAGRAPGLLEAFTTANHSLAHALRGVVRLLTRPGLLPLDFATLAGALRGHRARSALATVTARGPQRVTDALAALQASPLLGGDDTLARASSVLAAISGGADLALPEVNQLARELRACCAANALILGAAVDEALNDTLALTIIATEQAGVAEESTASEPAAPSADGPGFDSELVPKPGSPRRPASRVMPAAPELTPQARAELLARHAPAAGRVRRRTGPRMQQQQLALDVVSVSRFDKAHPTIRDGENLDQPTFIRRGVVLN